MKKLTKFIKTSNIIEKLKLNDKLYFLLKCEYCEPLLETKGMPDGIREDSQYIASLIRKYAPQNLNKSEFTININLSKLKLKYFDSLIIKVIFITDGSTNADISSKKLNFTINVYLNKKDCGANLSPLICHELLHGIVYSINSLSKGENSNNRNSRLKYDKIFNTEPNNDLEEITRKMMYAFQEDELNAYISQITLEIENQKPQTADAAYLLLLNNNIYKSYLIFGEALSNYKYHSNICNYYRKYSTTIISKNKKETNEYILKSNKLIIKKLKQRYRYIQKRFEKIIPRLCLEHLIDTGLIGYSEPVLNFLNLKQFE